MLLVRRIHVFNMSDSSSKQYFLKSTIFFPYTYTNYHILTVQKIAFDIYQTWFWTNKKGLVSCSDSNAILSSSGSSLTSW